MPYPLNNVTTQDTYVDATTLNTPYPSQKAQVIITNATAFMQIERLDPGVKPGSGQFLAEELKVPGVYSFTREYNIGFIRFRSVVSGVPAQVTASIGD